MLLDPDSREVTALLDWEMVDDGHPLRDWPSPGRRETLALWRVRTRTTASWLE